MQYVNDGRKKWDEEENKVWAKVCDGRKSGMKRKIRYGQYVKSGNEEENKVWAIYKRTIKYGQYINVK